MSVLWKMIDSKTFVGEKDGYIINIKLGAALGAPYWEIVKDNTIIDSCYYHSRTKDELTAKVLSERLLEQLTLNYKPMSTDKRIEDYIGKEALIICRDYSSSTVTLTEKHLRTYVSSDDIIILKETGKVIDKTTII